MAVTNSAPVEKPFAVFTNSTPAEKPLTACTNPTPAEEPLEVCTDPTPAEEPFAVCTDSTPAEEPFAVSTSSTPAEKPCTSSTSAEKPCTNSTPAEKLHTNSAPAKKPFAVCVFCGACPGTNPLFMETARSLAGVFHSNGWSLVYGGGTVGLMGAVASAHVKLGGDVHGIIPAALINKEQTGNFPSPLEFGRTTVVHDMHERKAMMGKESDAFVALPGGFGTMEELFEIVTWNQLGIHDCPIVILNVGGFYDGLLGWIRNSVKQGFIPENVSTIISEAKSVEEVAEKIKNYRPAPGRFNLDWESR